MDFFIVKCFSFKSLQNALYVLSHYMVKMESYSNGDHPSSTYLKVSRLIEDRRPNMVDDVVEAMDVLFHSSALPLCPHCERHQDYVEECNHKTFFCLKSEFDERPKDGGMMEMLLEENFGE